VSDDPPPPPAPVVDLLPLIRARQISLCPHTSVTVDETIAELTCSACQRSLDPWWYLRRLAHDSAEWVAAYKRQAEAFQRMVDDHNAWVTHVNKKRAELQQEIIDLTRQRDDLWNTPVHGVALINYRRRRTARPRK